MYGYDEPNAALNQILVAGAHYFPHSTQMGEVLALAEIAERFLEEGPRNGQYRFEFFGQKSVMN